MLSNEVLNNEVKKRLALINGKFNDKEDLKKKLDEINKDLGDDKNEATSAINKLVSLYEDFEKATSYEEALKLAQEIFKDEPNDLDVKTRLIYFKAKSPDEFLEEAEKLEKENRDAFYKGNNIDETKLSENTNDYYSEIPNRGYLRLIYNIADINYKRANFEKAKEIYDKLILLNPSDSLNSMGRVAMLLLREGKTEEILLLKEKYKNNEEIEIAYLFSKFLNDLNGEEFITKLLEINIYLAFVFSANLSLTRVDLRELQSQEFTLKGIQYAILVFFDAMNVLTKEEEEKYKKALEDGAFKFNILDYLADNDILGLSIYLFEKFGENEEGSIDIATIKDEVVNIKGETATRYKSLLLAFNGKEGEKYLEEKLNFLSKNEFIFIEQDKAYELIALHYVLYTVNEILKEISDEEVKA